MSVPRISTTSNPNDRKITLVDSYNFSGSKSGFKVVRANPDPNTACNVKNNSSLENTNSDTKEITAKSDVKKNTNLTEPIEPDYHGTPPSWRKLQRFFINAVRIKHPSIKSQSARHKQAASYINCWVVTGHSYTELRQMIRESDSRVQQGSEAHDALKRRQWTILNKKRRLFEDTISISFLIDKTVEFFQTEIRTDGEATVKEEPGEPDLYADNERRLEIMGNYIEMGFRVNTKGSPEDTDASLQVLNKMVELYERHNGKLT